MVKKHSVMKKSSPWNLVSFTFVWCACALVGFGAEWETDNSPPALVTGTPEIAPLKDFPIALFFPLDDKKQAALREPVTAKSKNFPAFRDVDPLVTKPEQTVGMGDWLSRTDKLIVQYLLSLEAESTMPPNKSVAVAPIADPVASKMPSSPERKSTAPDRTLTELLSDTLGEKPVELKAKTASLATVNSATISKPTKVSESVAKPKSETAAATSKAADAIVTDSPGDPELVARRLTAPSAPRFRNTYRRPAPVRQAAPSTNTQKIAPSTRRSPIKDPAKSSATTTTATQNVAGRSSVVDEAIPTPTSSLSADKVLPPAPRAVYTPAEPAVAITRKMQQLRPRIEKALRFYDGKPLNTQDDSAWSIMHSILGYGVNGMVAMNGPKGRRTNAINWMCWNYPCANRRLLYLNKGYIYGHEGPGSQGHPGQFLAMLAQVNLKRDYPVHVQGQAFTVEDLINSEMYTCDSKRELTFKLIALSHYLPSDARWKSESGEVWSIPKLLEIELAQPVNGAACGGTHRIMAINFALKTRQMRGEPITGIYARASQYVTEYQRYAMTLRNRDGSFSSDWFKRRSDWGDKDRQLQTTGHILEWLVYSVRRDQLSDPRIVETTDFLTYLMTRHRYHDWEVGPRGHALRALSLYYRRVFQQPRAGTPIVAVAPTESVMR